jgi:hypothetical protein
MAKSKSPKEVGPNYGPETIEEDENGLPIRSQCKICVEPVIFEASHGKTSEDRLQILQEQWVRHLKAEHQERRDDGD